MSSLPVRSASRKSRAAEAVAAAVPMELYFPLGEFVIPPSAHTLAGFRAWAKSDEYPDRGRICFLDGVIFIDMSQEEIQTHVVVKGEFYRGILNLNRRLKRGQFYGDGTLISNEAANIAVIPDGSFATWETLESGRAQLVPREGAEGQYMEILGTVDMVLEVISNSSVGKDARRLRTLYHRAGIAEYWLVDARQEEIDFKILLWAEGDYTTQEERGGWQTSRVFDRRFRLVRRKGRMGMWEYTLQNKSC